MLLQSQPRADGISLRIEAIELFSYAHKLPVCMYAGAQKDQEGNLVGWRGGIAGQKTGSPTRCSRSNRT
jgi:3-oxoacyl-[acyl-carrier-protein] synthase-3